MHGVPLTWRDAAFAAAYGLALALLVAAFI
jgi:hypothetical protein